MTLLIVGDSWSKDDEDAGRPFAGTAGSLLRGCLSQAGIDIAEARLTCVFNRYTGDIKNLCGPKIGAVPHLPALVKGKFLRKEFEPDLKRLAKEIEHVKPTCILALGGTAAWALLHASGIKNIRGTSVACALPNLHSYKVFSTYHPAAIFREWKLRPIFISDLCKLRDELAFPEIRRPKREIWIEPDLGDLYRFEQEYILPSPQLSVDIETSGTMITCIGFAPNEKIALVVPFTAHGKPGNSYWPTVEDECKALLWCKRMCGLDKKILGQNIMYDMHHLWRNYGITTPHMTDDSMLLHHALQPEMEKGLGFLGSIYTKEASWKFMRRHNETVKRED
jgi:uracil-DNA glycosylase